MSTALLLPRPRSRRGSIRRVCAPTLALRAQISLVLGLVQRGVDRDRFADAGGDSGLRDRGQASKDRGQVSGSGGLGAGSGLDAMIEQGRSVEGKQPGSTGYGSQSSSLERII